VTEGERALADSVTVRDVAKHAEVSIGTVSRVLNNRSNVNEEIRQRVFKAATELGYFGLRRQNSQAGASAQMLGEIGFLLILSHAEQDKGVSIDPFWAHILQGAEREAQKSNIKVTYRWLGRLTDPADLRLHKIYEMRLGGFLLVGSQEPEIVRAIYEMQTPLVLVDTHIPKMPVDSVLSDNFEGAKEAVEYLISEGHRQIAFIGGPALPDAPYTTKVYTVEWRSMGYRKALENAGISLDYELIESSNLVADGGYEACKRLLAKKRPFSAIFCANDPTAIGTLKALREGGLRVPEDVSVVGFDDDLAEHFGLTTVRVNKEEMGAVAVRTLIDRAADLHAPPVTITLDVALIKRDTVGPYIPPA
jgi:DNA-binding LacI/PurR family transcriptional regulator